MVSWRAVRPVLLILMISTSVIIMGAGMVLDIAPLQYIADLRDRVAQPDPTPSVIPPTTPLPEGAATAAIPHYPPLVIAVPPEPLFAERTTVAPPTVQPHLAGSFLGGGNCLMNDGTRASFLPDCVVGDEITPQAGQ